MDTPEEIGAALLVAARSGDEPEFRRLSAMKATMLARDNADIPAGVWWAAQVARAADECGMTAAEAMRPRDIGVYGWSVQLMNYELMAILNRPVPDAEKFMYSDRSGIAAAPLASPAAPIECMHRGIRYTAEGNTITAHPATRAKPAIAGLDVAASGEHRLGRFRDSGAA